MTTTGETMTLSEFLLARIAEDEAAACAAWTPGPWELLPGVGKPTVSRATALGRVAVGDHKTDAAHIARHDPARVLAECEAKRRFIREAEDQVSDYFSRFILETLATVYADHPDYRDEWKP